jgi:hypothetical protein
MMENPISRDDTSWWDELINGLTNKQPQVQPPPAPQPPPVDQSAWEKSVEQAKVSDSLGSVHDLGLRIYQETKSYSDRPDSNDPIDVAREKMGWAIINADKKWGFDRQKRASTASAIEPSAQELNNPAVRAAYQSSIKAAREAFLGWKDPTNGAVHLYQATTPDMSNLKFKNGTPEGVKISTHSGPYDNTYTKGQVPSSTVWLNTYFPE